MSSRFDQLAEGFLSQGLYLRNWSLRTIRTYKQGLGSLRAALTLEQQTTGNFSKDDLDRWVIGLRHREMSPGGCNMYIRTINSFLSWLAEDGHRPERLRVKLLRVPQRQKTLSPLPISKRSSLSDRPRPTNAAHGL